MSTYYLIELRDCDGHDCADTVYDLLVEALTKDAAVGQAYAYIEKKWPDDESDGGEGTFHPCDCQCDHFVGNGVPGKQVGICDECMNSWECSHGGVLLDTFSIEEYESYTAVLSSRNRSAIRTYHVLVDLTKTKGQRS